MTLEPEFRQRLVVARFVVASTHGWKYRSRPGRLGPASGRVSALRNVNRPRSTQMPTTWTEKQERKYEHIRDSERDQGASPRRAKEIAARTVNKERAQRGQAKTSSRSSTNDMSSSRRGGLRSGTNRPKGRTKAQLYNEAKQRGIEGRSKMTKAQLQRAVDAKKR